MDRKQIAAVFEEIGQLLELKGENPFRVRAYYNAARTVDRLQEDLQQLVDGQQLTAIKGIGADLAGKITEMVRTGRLRYHEELKASVPEGLLELLRIPMLGPKRAKIVHDRLGVDCFEKLEAACRAGNVAALEGFGEKSQKKILEGIALVRQFSARHHIHRARAAAEPVFEALRSQPGVIRCSIAGSLRRHRETIGDIDFLVSSKPKDAPAIMELFTQLPDVQKIVAAGATKSSVVLRGGMQADLRVVTDAQYPFALNYFTGSKEHNIALRARSLKLKQLSLNEYGFSPAREKSKSAKELGSSIPCRTEEELYQTLGLQYVPPELREDTGEIEAAENEKLPGLITRENLRGTFHCHSTWSDGTDSIEKMARAAIDLGLDYLGIADHSKGQRQANGLDERRLRQQAAEIGKLNTRFAKERFRLFFGVEVDILPNGEPEFGDDTLALCDYVIGAVHSGFQMTADTMTTRIVHALAHPRITMLAHPTGRLLLEREAYAVNMPAVIEAAAKHGKIIEINAHPWRLDMDWRWWKHAAALGVRCAINPDAHSASDLQYLALGVAIARKGWLTKTDVINSLSAKEVARLFKK